MTLFIDRPVGIDLGTTNSEIAILDPSERDLLVYHDKFKRRTIPSAVAWDPKKEAFLVGRPARQRRGKEPPPIESIKRKMGQVTEVQCGPHALKPEDVSGKILAEVTARMREFLVGRTDGGVEVRVERAVITVPAYFDAPQVEATRAAAELAGLDPIGILQEPTAAAIYHTWRRQLGDGNFLVYDFGGGTFDVSILRCLGGEYQVVALDGDNYLGGDDFDKKFAEHLRKKLVEQGYALDLDVVGDEDDRNRFGRLVHLAQEVKESLSTRDVLLVSKSDIVEDKNGEMVELETEIGRAEYEEVVGDLVETTLQACRRAVAAAEEKAAVGLADIDNVILVGGSTRVPLVVQRVTAELCAPSKADQPLQDEVDTCVALGAAVHAAQIGGLRVGSEKAQVLFTTPMVSKKTPIKLGMKIEKAPEGAKELAVVRGDDELTRSPYAQGDTSLIQVAIPLTEDADQACELHLLDDADETVASLPFSLHRGDVRPRASSLSRPAVVSKDIAIEVLKAGRRDRRVLLPRGSGLPMKAEQTFYTADQSGAVVLRILQGRTPIKTLAIQVPEDLAVGSKVTLSIRCDEAMRLEAKAEVAGQELWATVEPPEAPRFDPKGNVEALIEQAETTQRTLWGHRGDYFRRESDRLTAAIREVVTTDPDKLSVLCTKLQGLVAEYQPDPNSGGLAPPFQHFEAELDGLRRVVYRARGLLIGMDQAAWEERIGDLQERADHAWQASDPIGWRRVVNEVQALHETAMQQEFSDLKLDDPAYLTRRLTSVLHHATHIERELADFVPSATSEVRDLQLRARDQLMADLESKVKSRVTDLSVGEGSDINDVRRRLDAASTELERLDGALERLPSLGLVTEHGGGSGPA